MTAEQFEGQWRKGRRSFAGVDRIEVSPEYIRGWESRTRSLRFEREQWLGLVEALPRRCGNYLRLERIDELDAELTELCSIRHHVLTINAAPRPQL